MVFHVHLGDMNLLSSVKLPQQCLTEASESPGLCRASNCNSEACPEEEKSH